MATRVLIVDDSITMRALFTSALESNKELVVVGAANGADEARQMIKECYPDVITLDIEMPGKNGIEFLEELMETKPMPIVMLSTLTQKGAEISMKAIELGAVDCFPKPQKTTPDEFQKIAGALCKTVLTAAKTNLAARRPRKKVEAPVATGYVPDGRLIAIAGGMGGMEAAAEMLAAFPANCPPTLVVLDMDEGLAVPFASKLAQSIAPKVKVADDGEKLEIGTVYVAVNPGRHVVIDRWPEGSVRLLDREPLNGCRPSADLLFATMSKTAAAKAHCVLLSGGGNDGASGIAAVAGSGGQVYGQSPDTALVAENLNAARDKGLTQFGAPADLAGFVLGARLADAA